MMSFLADITAKYNLPEWLGFSVDIIINFIITAVFVLTAVIILVLFERKYLAFFTRRKGPNRVGPWGAFQTVADAVKLLFKENITPDNADKLIYYISPLLVFAPIMFVWFLMPYCTIFTPYPSDVGALLFLAVLTVPVLSVIFAGYSSGNKYSLIGGIRSCIQAVSSEVPVFLVLASVVILSGSLDINYMVKEQSGLFFNWNIFPNILGFIIFFICSLIIMNRIPFDFPEAESELVAGYHTEYSGMKFAMFFLGEYALTFILCAYISALFLGGYNPPIGIYLADIFNIKGILYQILINFEQLFWFLAKTSLIIMLVMWIRASYPRLRTDKTLELCWYILIPSAVFNLFIITAVKYFRGIL